MLDSCHTRRKFGSFCPLAWLRAGTLMLLLILSGMSPVQAQNSSATPPSDAELVARQQLAHAQTLSKQAAIDAYLSLLDMPVPEAPDIHLQALEALFFLYIRQGDYEAAEATVTQYAERAQVDDGAYHHIQAILMRGFLADQQSHFSTAEQLYRDALEEAQSIGHNELMARAYERISSVLRRQDKYIEALQIAQRSTNVLRDLGEDLLYLSALQNLGIIQAILGDYTTALATLTQVFELATKLDNQPSIADALYETGEVYRKMGNFEQALPHFQQAHEIDIRFGNKLYIGNSAMKIGYIELERQEYETALHYARKAYGLYLEVDSKTGQARVLNLQGLIALKQNNLSEAQTHLAQGLALASQHQFESIVVLLQISTIKLAQAQQRHEDAIALSDTALAAATSMQDKKHRLELHELRATSFEALELHQQALAETQAYHTLSDALGQNQHNLTLAALQSKVEFMRKQQEIESLNLDRALHQAELSQREWQLRAWWLASAALFILISALAYRQVKKRKLAAERATLLQEVVDKKNAMLADVSHEIRTPLTALQLQVEALQFNIAQDVDASYNTINRKLSDINRLISDIHQLAMADSQSLHLNLVQCNLTEVMALWEQEFAQFTHGKGFDWEAQIQLTGEVTISWDVDRIKQVLTNLIANSTLYTDKPGKQRLTVWQQRQHIHITLEDTAPGVADEHLSEIFERLFRVEKSRSRRTGGSGLGLAICKSLIEAHQGTIYAQHSELGGLKMVIELPQTVS
ncbi:tetratricopeptide repeat protein [Pseudoalteromonas rubra]|uniref:tetratricopeptide repeat protein n=1 Tax=Pseudoalteromonas rubra TaxID=43658 RepID=UPI000F79A7C2|nr:tetratricopeptide repeat protein [Pseudoalteromonas rubra]